MPFKRLLSPTMQDCLNILISQRVCLPLGFRQLICWVASMQRGKAWQGPGAVSPPPLPLQPTRGSAAQIKRSTSPGMEGLSKSQHNLNLKSLHAKHSLVSAFFCFFFGDSPVFINVSDWGLAPGNVYRGNKAAN